VPPPCGFIPTYVPSRVPFAQPTCLLETTMLRLACCFVLTLLAIPLMSAVASETFPFGSALFLDSPPLPGSKRIPMIEIQENGAAAFNLWCANVSGSANVDANTITIMPAKALSVQCTPDRLTRDTSLLTALMQVTSWQRHGDVIDLLGATNLRFRVATN
jgi:META domain